MIEITDRFNGQWSIVSIKLNSQYFILLSIFISLSAGYTYLGFYSTTVIHSMRFIGLLGTIPQFIIVIAVLMYAARRSSAEAVLMAIGSITGLLSSIFYIIALPWLVETYGMDWYPSYSIPISGLATLGGLCFAIGLLLLVQDILKTKS